MQDKITIANAPECLNTNDQAMWVLGYQAAIEARSPCLLQIQEPTTKTEALAHYSQQAILAMDEAAPAAVAVSDALREAEAALEVAIARILKADPGHSISVTSEAKALVAVRAALSATSGAASPMPRLHIKELHGTTLPGGRVIGASTREYTVPAPAAVAVPVDVPAAGAIALHDYLQVCEQHAITPDVGGAFAYAFASGFNMSTVQSAPAVAAPDEREAFEDAAALLKKYRKLCVEVGRGDSFHLARIDKARAALAATPAADAEALQERINELDNGLTQAINERDTAEGWADGLADLIGKHFGRDIGEHSSAHCPWQEAKEIIEDAEPPAAAAPVVLPEQDAALLNQGIELLHALSCDERNRGNCSAAEGATASAYAVQRLAAALLATGGQAQAVEKSATHSMNLGQRILHVGGRENDQTYIEFGSVAAVRALVDQVLRDLPDGAPGFVLPAPKQADARDAEQEVLMEHSGCGSNTQVDMLTVRLNPGDKVVMHKGRITQGFDRANRAAIAAAKGE